jgi:putative membrane protein
MPGTTSVQDSNTGGDTIQNMRDKTFVRKASEGGLAEVQLGKLASEKGASDEVKSFGQKMVDDHTKLNEKMAPVADSMGVMAPKHLNKEDQSEYDKLSALSGDAFDKEYIAFMVKDHHADLREFRIEANNTTDASLKQVVTEGAQVIHDHMVMIDKIARSKGIATPGGRGGSTPSPAS